MDTIFIRIMKNKKEFIVLCKSFIAYEYALLFLKELTLNPDFNSYLLQESTFPNF